MKKLLLLLLFVGSFATAQTKNVYIWVDLTDESLLTSHKDKAKDAINTLFANLGDIDNALNIRIMGINHRLLPDFKRVIKLPKGTSGSWSITGMSLKERKIQVAKTKNKALEAIKEIEPINIYATRIFENIDELFFDLTEQDGEKIAIIFSDLLENSDIGSVYNNTLDVDKFKFAADLSDVKIYMIRDCPQEKQYNDLCDQAVGFWRNVFRSQGYRVRIDSSLEL